MERERGGLARGECGETDRDLEAVVIGPEGADLRLQILTKSADDISYTGEFSAVVVNTRLGAEVRLAKEADKSRAAPGR